MPMRRRCHCVCIELITSKTIRHESGRRLSLWPVSIPGCSLALQLPFCFEVRALSDRLVSSTPERPCDDVCGLDPLSSESDGDAADFPGLTNGSMTAWRCFCFCRGSAFRFF